MRLVALLLSLLCACALCQDATVDDKPWETWVPAQVDFPDPNSFALYEGAFKLIDQFGEAEPDASLEDLSILLENHRDTFLLLRAAITGDCRLPVVTSFVQTLPYLAKFRSAARLLAVRARVMREYGFFLESAFDSLVVDVPPTQ